MEMLKKKLKQRDQPGAADTAPQSFEAAD